MLPEVYAISTTAPVSTASVSRGMDYLSLSRGGKFEDAKPPQVGWAVYPYTGPSRLGMHADVTGGLDWV